MTRKKRIAAMLLASLLVALAVFGIASWTASHANEKPKPGLYADGKLQEPPQTMVAIGSYEIPFAEYRHYFLLMRSYFEASYGATIWEDDPDGEKAYVLRKSVEEELVNLYTWLAIAEENNIQLSEENRQEIADTLAEQKETYGDAFGEQLSGMYFTDEETYLAVTEKQKLMEVAQTEYRQQLRSEQEETLGAEADEEYGNSMITAKHILIAFPEEESGTETASSTSAAADSGAGDGAVTQTEEDILAEANSLYNQILNRVGAGEDLETVFDELMWANTDDMAGTEGSPNGYTFQDGDMVPEFYETAVALGEYELSQPVRTDYGYHILLRLPLDKEAMQQNRESAIDSAVTALIDEKVAQVSAGLTVTGNEIYDNLPPTGIQ